MTELDNQDAGFHELLVLFMRTLADGRSNLSPREVNKVDYINRKYDLPYHTASVIAKSVGVIYSGYDLF